MLIRVALVDDHPIVLDGLAATLPERAPIRVVARASTLADARAILAHVIVDIALVDLRLPDGSGFDLLRDVQRLKRVPSVLLLSSFLTQECLHAAIALGAAGFLIKTATADEIADAVRQVAAGHPAFTPEQLRTYKVAAWAPLTKREHDIVAGLMRGRSNHELSLELGLSHKTVEAHLSRLFARYGVLSRTELALLAEREQWLVLPVAPVGARPIQGSPPGPIAVRRHLMSSFGRATTTAVKSSTHAGSRRAVAHQIER